MGQRLAIPRILGLSWWWLLAVGIAESYVRYLFHLPEWVPSITGFWFIVQAVWLRMAEPTSKAVYLYVVFLVGEPLGGFALAFAKVPDWLASLGSIADLVLWIAAIFVFRAEMERHFKETDPRGIHLNGVMTFFFSGLYFQYWFQQIYAEQNEADLRLMPGSNESR
jgi:hypothetical protein